MVEHGCQDTLGLIFDEELGEGEGDVAVEGSAMTEDGKFVQYPDGFTITFVRAEPWTPSTIAAGDEDEDLSDLVRFTLLLENTGTATVTINNPGLSTLMSALSGVNQFDLEMYSVAGAEDLRNTMPNQLAPGTSFEVWETFRVPSDMRDALALTVNGFSTFSPTAPGMAGETYTPYTFLDVEQALA